MKKYFLILILLNFGLILQAQSNFPKGIKVGKIPTGASVITIDSITQSGTDYVKIWKGVKCMEVYSTKYVTRQDTLPLFSFVGGGGEASDTINFTTSSIYGSFFNDSSDTLVVTKMNNVMAHGAGLDTMGVQIQWHSTFLSGSAVKLNTNPVPIGRPSGTTTGTIDVSFNNPKIPPGVWVWCTTPYVPADILKRKPIYLSVSCSGYKIHKY